MKSKIKRLAFVVLVLILTVMLTACSDDVVDDGLGLIRRFEFETHNRSVDFELLYDLETKVLYVSNRAGSLFQMLNRDGTPRVLPDKYDNDYSFVKNIVLANNYLRIKDWSDAVCLATDPETDVMYLMYFDSYGSGYYGYISPLYNADGSLKSYSASKYSDEPFKVIYRSRTSLRIYDVETRVVYLVSDRGELTPMRNADGSIVLYDTVEMTE